MSIDLAIFLIGIVVTVIACAAIMLLYAPAAAHSAHQEHSGFARFTLKVLRFMGLEAWEAPERSTGTDREGASNDV
jgi:hypothetical protein